MSGNAASIVFTGDIGFDHYMAGRFADDQLLSSEIAEFCRSADHVVANVEGALLAAPANVGRHDEPIFFHAMDPGAVKVLKTIGADIWSINNNHIMDAGEQGMAATLREAKACGAVTLGAGMDLQAAKKPVILEEAGGIGMIAVGYQRGCKPAGEHTPGCFSWSDMDGIATQIAAIKQRCRWCVVVSHGGEEFTALPSPYTRDRYLKYLELGADVVVAHHPHVPMNYETVGEKAVFYSLGNFIFDTDYQRAQYHTEDGVLLKLCFTDTAYSFEPLGIRIDRETERVISAPLSPIFTDIPCEEYRLLAPLAARMFVEATKRQQRFLYPEQFADENDALWQLHFENPLRAGRVPGEALDFSVILPLAEQEKTKLWKTSRLDAVKAYILEQM